MDIKEDIYAHLMRQLVILKSYGSKVKEEMFRMTKQANTSILNIFYCITQQAILSLSNAIIPFDITYLILTLKGDYDF